MHTLFNDLRYAARMWRRTPGFTLVAILTLALGIGANTTMFSVVNAALLRPLPFPDADRLMTVWRGRIEEPSNLQITSLPNYRDWKSSSRSFESLGLFDSAGRGYNLGGGAEPEQVSGVRVTASFFEVLGVTPMLGRTFVEAEEAAGRDRVVVLSHGLWTRRYGADRSILGRTIQIDGSAYQVVGVMPAEFQFQFWSGPRQLWVPAGWTEGDQDRSSNSFICVGRLRPGVTLVQARSEMETLGRALAASYPDANQGRTIRLVPIAEYGVGELRPALLTLLAVVGFVLLIACANIANLMLARAAVRQREFAVRSALGASRGRIVRQLLTESVLLALAGGAAGVLIAAWGTTLLSAALPNTLQTIPLRPLAEIQLDRTVLLFALAVSCLSGVLFGLAPAVVSFRDDLAEPLKENARGSTGTRSRARYALVASEVALSVIVLAGAGVMIASLMRLLAVDPGLDPERVLVMGMSVPQENLYYGPPGNPRFCEGLEEQVGSVPGVVAVSAIAHLPLTGAGAGRGIAIEGRPEPAPEDRPGAGYSVTCPAILETLGIPLVAGREFSAGDKLGAPGVAIVNETFAKEFWPGEDAVGQRFQIRGPEADAPWLTVVGVSRDVRQYRLDGEVEPWFWRPYQQAGWPSVSIVVKTASAPLAFERAVRKAVAIVEPEQPVSNVRSMETIIGASVSGRRFPMLLLSAFAMLALVLAAVGIAGVVGYSVVQRTQEIGVRMALGAQPGDVVQMLVGQSLKWTVGGLAAGLCASFVLLRFLDKLLYGVTGTHTFVLAVVSLILLAVAGAASYLPARRAMRVNPVNALRGV